MLLSHYISISRIHIFGGSSAKTVFWHLDVKQNRLHKLCSRITNLCADQ